MYGSYLKWECSLAKKTNKFSDVHTTVRIEPQAQHGQNLTSCSQRLVSFVLLLVMQLVQGPAAPQPGHQQGCGKGARKCAKGQPLP